MCMCQPVLVAGKKTWPPTLMKSIVCVQRATEETWHRCFLRTLPCCDSGQCLSPLQGWDIPLHPVWVGGGPAVCTHTEVKAGLWWLGSTCSRLSSIFGWLIVSEEVVVRAWKQEFVGGNSSCWWGKMMAQSRSFRRDEGCGRSSLLDTHTSSLRLASF